MFLIRTFLHNIFFIRIPNGICSKSHIQEKIFVNQRGNKPQLTDNIVVCMHISEGPQLLHFAVVYESQWNTHLA